VSLPNIFSPSTASQPATNQFLAAAHLTPGESLRCEVPLQMVLVAAFLWEICSSNLVVDCFIEGGSGGAMYPGVEN